MLLILLALAALGAAAALLSVVLSANMIVVTTYAFDSPKIETPVTLLVLSDMHEHLFRDGNGELVSRVAREKPDAILIPGDGLNWYSEGHDYLTQLVSALTHIAPVYFTTGNHDAKYMTQSRDYGLLDELERAGATALTSGYVDTVIAGQPVRIGGVYEAVYNKDDIAWADYTATDEYRFLADFEDTDGLKILMAHQPSFMINDRAEARWDIDLALCGHEHGGQVRLPLIGGFYSTHLGWFSPYLDGAHLINGIPTVISRGLSTYTKGFGRFIPPRFFNLPEIVRVQVR